MGDGNRYRDLDEYVLSKMVCEWLGRKNEYK